MARRLRTLLTVLGPVALLLAGRPASAGDELIDSPMFRDPLIPLAEAQIVIDGPTDLWLKALARPEAEMRCRAAQAIALARRHGMKDMEPLVAPLRAELDRPNQHRTVALAAAQALVELDVRDAAPSLLHQAAAGDGDLRDAVEPVLARWDYRPARELWLARLRDPAASPRGLVLAIQGLAAVKEMQAAEPLRELVLAPRTSAPVRQEAARALGLLRDNGLLPDAERLSADPSPRGLPARLAAAALLRRHRGEAAVALLQRLARDADPAVAAPAVRRLLELDPPLVVPMADPLLASPDAALRSLAVDTQRLVPSQERIPVLADRMGDPHPDVRRNASRSLTELGGKQEFRERVLAEGTRVLAGKDWRGLEQATILLAQLDHKPAAPRFIELLTFDRPEVLVTAGWGLRKLAVADTLPAVLRHVQARQRKIRATAAQADASYNTADLQLAQLNQLLGQQNYAPADAALQEFIPRMEVPMRPVLCPESRAAAIWALGLLHPGDAPPGLARALEARVNDSGSMPREDQNVCCMSAVALGRMKSKQSLPSLRRNGTKKLSIDPIRNACGWAIEQITGEKLLPADPFREVRYERFFLAPAG
jgi:HEAT repeat protein